MPIPLSDPARPAPPPRARGEARPVVLNWQVAGNFGWGVYGLNLLLEWARSGRCRGLSAVGYRESELALDPLRRHVIAPALDASRALVAELAASRARRVVLEGPVLHSASNDFVLPVRAVTLAGQPDVALMVFDEASFSPTGLEFARRFDAIVTGSTWNQQLLEEAGLPHCRLIFQGIDNSRFQPRPRVGWLRDRFAVFSGGKLEYRKGQDLTVQAFRAFAARHPEALLVTGWWSPWPATARTLDRAGRLTPISFDAEGAIDTARWTSENGIAPEQVLHLGRLDHRDLPAILVEMDAALFPNRCEGGTNLVAMEAMACGVPTILSANTGHLDLLGTECPGNEVAHPLTRQTPLAGRARRGWGESDIDEAVEALEALWRDRDAAAEMGRRGADWMTQWGWNRTADRIADLLDEISPV